MNEYSLYTLGALAICLLITGAVAGVLAGLLGVGGGIVIVPMLFIVFDFLNISDVVSMHIAVATSLATIVPTSISSARAHYQRGSVDLDIFKSWAPFVFFGALSGGLMSKYQTTSNLTLIFGCIGLLVALNMAMPRTIVLAEKIPQGWLSRVLIPAFIGSFSALMGIGGGTLSVPVLSTFSTPIHRAVGTASAFGLVIAVPAVLGFIWSGWSAELRPPFSLGYVSLPAAVLIFLSSVLCAPYGARLAHSFDSALLKKVFAVFLLITSLRMLQVSLT